MIIEFSLVFSLLARFLWSTAFGRWFAGELLALVGFGVRSSVFFPFQLFVGGLVLVKDGIAGTLTLYLGRLLQQRREVIGGSKQRGHI